MQELIRKKMNFFKLSKMVPSIFIITIFLITSVGIVAVFIKHEREIKARVLERNMVQIEQISERIKLTMDRELKNSFYILEILAEIIQEDENHSAMILNSLEKKGDFTFFGISDIEGELIISNGKKHQIKIPQLLEAIKNGKRYNSDILDIRGEEEKEICLSVPLYKNGKVSGALIGIYPISKIARKIEQQGELKQYFQIVDTNGVYIALSQSKYALGRGIETLWEELKGYNFLEGESLDEVIENVKTRKEGKFIFQYKDKKRYVNYEPLGINNWYLFAVLTQEKLVTNIVEIQKILKSFFIYLVVFILIFNGLIAGMGYNIYRVLKNKNKEIEIKNEIFKHLLYKTDDIIFEINSKHDKGILSLQNHNQKEREGVFSLDTIHPENMLKNDYIKIEHFPLYNEIYKKILDGEEVDKVIIEFKKEGEWKWFYVHSMAINSNNIIGILQDCTEERKKDVEIVKISEKSKYDFLTGLYNRENFEIEVEKFLGSSESKEGINALFIIDLDNFKRANDTFGHIIGDKILQDTAVTLKEVSSERGFAGRLGGDEFVLFVKNLLDMETLKIIAEKLNDSLAETYTIENESVDISGSIGIVIARENDRFKELYKSADKALYFIKSKGKNSYFVS